MNASIAMVKNETGPFESRAASPAPRADEAVSGELEPLPRARRKATAEFERRYLATLLARAGGSMARAVSLAGVSRQMLQRLMRKHGVSLRTDLEREAPRSSYLGELGDKTRD
jgi:DNA-binding NtrC family response regulator